MRDDWGGARGGVAPLRNGVTDWWCNHTLKANTKKAFAIGNDIMWTAENTYQHINFVSFFTSTPINYKENSTYGQVPKPLSSVSVLTEFDCTFVGLYLYFEIFHYACQVRTSCFLSIQLIHSWSKNKVIIIMDLVLEIALLVIQASWRSLSINKLSSSLFILIIIIIIIIKPSTVNSRLTNTPIIRKAAKPRQK